MKSSTISKWETKSRMVQLNNKNKANFTKWKINQQDHSIHKFRKLKGHHSKEEPKTIILKP